MATITIYRPPSTTIATVEIDSKTVFSKKLMGEHKIVSEFFSSTVLSIAIGDFITHNTENYYINRTPNVTKINDSTYLYKIEFESVLYDLNKKLFISSDGLAEYSYNGTALDFVTNIVANINIIGSGWSVGTVDSTEYQTLVFSNESCRAALVKVAEAFKLEFSLTGKAISMIATIGTATAFTFEYGRDKGLYKLERQQVSDQNIITKVFGFGGTRNIPYDYRSRAKRLVFESGGDRYLTKNTSTYGVIEGQYTDDNIFPQRTSTFTDVNIDFNAGISGTEFNNRSSYLEDSTLDFDLNDYLIEGQTAKVVFKSGDLAGVECEIWKYDATNKRIYINPYTDPDGYTLPFYNAGSPILPVAGDSYTLVDMEMPSTYVTAAETALEAATQAFLDENSVPRVVYSIEIDPKYAKSVSLDVDAGDQVTIVDTALGINALIRITGIEYPLTNVNKIKAVISDFIPYTLQERVVKTAIENKKDIVATRIQAEELAWLNSLRLAQKGKIITVPTYQGVYAAGTTYYGNPSRIDIVKYGAPEVYYIARPDAPSESWSGIVPTNIDYWKVFEAQYSSIATNLLFAELAYIDNLGVKYFNGVPVGAGDLAGSVAATQANVTGQAEIDTLTLSGSGGSANISCNGISRLCTWDSTLPQTAETFFNNYAGDFAGAGVTLTYSGNDLIFTSEVGVALSSPATISNVTPDLSGTVADTQEAIASVARIDTITLSGTGGVANILCDGVTKMAEWNDLGLTAVAANFVSLYAAAYLSGGVVVTSSGSDIIFTAQVAGVNFTGSTTITNITNPYQGAIKIEGNKIYESSQDNDTYGAILINTVGYNGGRTRKRKVYIGDGIGNTIAYFDNYPSSGNARFVLSAGTIAMLNIPTSSAGLNVGEIYRDGTTLKIVT